MAQGLINNGVSVTKDFSPNEYELLSDYTVSGSAITSFTFGTLLEPLRINADEEVRLVLEIANNSGYTSANYLFINNNTTQTNYYNQEMYASSTTIGSSRNNNAFVNVILTSSKLFCDVYIKLTNNGYATVQTNASQYVGSSSIGLSNVCATSVFTLSQINSLTLSASITNGIGIGSRFQLYKVKGQVQQTWATT